MVEVTLPRLVGTREAVGEILQTQDVDATLGGAQVVLFARAVASMSPSFADELIKELVVDRHADKVLLVGGSERLIGKLESAAKRRKVSDKFSAGKSADVVW